MQSKSMVFLAVLLALTLVIPAGCIPDGKGGFGCPFLPPLPEILDIWPTATPSGSPKPTVPGGTPDARIVQNLDMPAPARIMPSTSPPPFKPVTGTIETGARVDAGGFEISAAGGTVSLQGSGTPLDGLKLEIPVNAFKQTTNFNISFAPVTSHTFGSKFKIVSPLFNIGNGGVVSEQVLKVELPAAIPTGYFAMAFYYDNARKRLEALPLLSQGPASVTVATRHFSDVVVAAVLQPEVPLEVDSGFRPGIDDWQFTNYGSALAPGGHCAGQVISAMWYYVEKPDGASTRLWGKYDNNGQQPATPKYWEDDSNGYRLASMVQNDVAWDGLIWDFLLTLPNYVPDFITLAAFAFAMQETGEPQLVGVFDSKKGGGHALVVYRVTQEGLWVADPNYPSDGTRIIRWNGVGFEPYNSGANAEEIKKGNFKLYDKILFAAKSAIVSWPLLSTRYQEMKSGVIGMGAFPDYKFFCFDDQGNRVEVRKSADISTNKNALAIEWEDPSSKNIILYINRDGESLTAMDLTRLDGRLALPLTPGLNKYGVSLWTKDSGGKTRYIDHLYLNINYGGPQIQPASLDGVVGTSYTFKASGSGGVAVAEYAWDFGDNSTVRSPSAQVYHTFAKAGTYTVYVALYDKAGKIIGEARAPARISDKAVPTPAGTVSLSTLLKSMKTVQVKLQYNADVSYTVAGQSPTSASRQFTINFPVTGADNQLFLIGTPDASQAIAWNGNAFSGSQGDQATSAGQSRITGSFPYEDTLNLNAVFSRTKLPVSANSLANTHSQFEVANLRIQRANLVTSPITPDQKEVRFEFTGSQVRPYLRNMGNSSETLIYNTNRKEYELSNAAVQNTVDWNTLKLIVTFRR